MKKVSLDEVLLILNDHIDEPARVTIHVFDESGASPGPQVLMLGDLVHWSSHEELMQAALADADDMNERKAAGVTSWGPMLMERWRGTYMIGTTRLDLSTMPDRWLAESPDLGDDYKAAHGVQVWLSEHDVSLGISVGVEYFDEDE